MLSKDKKSPSMPNIRWQRFNMNNTSLPILPNNKIINDNKLKSNNQDQFKFKDQPHLSHLNNDNNGDIINNNNSSLSIPNSISNQISIASSLNYSNLSVIDLYGAQEDDVPSEQDQDQDQDQDLDGDIVDDEGYVHVSEQLHPHIVKKSSNIDPSSRLIKDHRNQIPIINNDNILKSDRDRYGFKKSNNFISESDYNQWWISYSQHLIRRKKKWNTLILKNGLSLNKDNPKRFPPKSEKLKRYIRKGIPSEWRGNAWWYFAKGSEVLQEGFYDKLIESSIDLMNKDVEIINRDLNRTFPDNIYFKKIEKDDADNNDDDEPEMIQQLRRVLVAFSIYQPSIGYCQSMNFIAGLLLIFLDEERAFWMLVIITKRLLPGLHEINLEGVSIHQGVLMLALRDYLPSIFEKFLKINLIDDEDENIQSISNYEFLNRLPPVMLTTSSWFMSIFIGILPIETTLRVWDCLFAEDSCFLFKTSIAIFKLIEPKLLMNGIDEMEIFTTIQNSPKYLLDSNKIFDLIFKRGEFWNKLTQDDIERCKKFVYNQRKQKNHYKDNNKDSSNLKFNRNLLNDKLWNEDLYGFKKNIGVLQWNKKLSERMKLNLKKNFTKS
ncbi:hypothetical protein WICMUC_003078 [Wickerhamomyces mucosus]|uniref:Rab-GAP TBC domain-containing protein n=1 Tax=Wickerhamomyces mucosus TaxID=1378264 RepID=A0A9P8PM07_9ASCO|nr:hypothetical protein WICMUC_003078 [Wickerhamomyces mucosus]